MAYSIDFRRRALEYMEEGHTYEELYEAFKIYPSRIAGWRKLVKETGELKAQYNETREGKIDMVELAAALERKPDATLAELAEPFVCTEQAVHYALERLKITVKKNNSATKSKAELK